MNKFIIALIAVMMLFISGCASTGGASASSGASDGGGLPEIAAYDDEAVEDLPDMVAAE
jgi:hypothetical protein